MFESHPDLSIMRALIPILLVLAAVPSSAQPARDDSSAAMTADAFSRAIVAHDSVEAARLLAVDARILEGGQAETREQYLAHHFHADAAFVAGMERTPLSRTIRAVGDVAWVLSTSRMTGTYRDREIDVVSAETLVMKWTPDGWRIASVHWSSGSPPR